MEEHTRCPVKKEMNVACALSLSLPYYAPEIRREWGKGAKVAQKRALACKRILSVHDPLVVCVCVYVCSRFVGLVELSVFPRHWLPRMLQSYSFLVVSKGIFEDICQKFHSEDINHVYERP